MPTKPELIKINARLAAENDALRTQVSQIAFERDNWKRRFETEQHWAQMYRRKLNSERGVSDTNEVSDRKAKMLAARAAAMSGGIVVKV